MNYEYTVQIKADAAKVWEILHDVERWPEWTTSMTSVEILDKPLAVGSRVKIKQPKLRPATMTVSSLDHDQSFSWTSDSPGMHTEADHEIAPSSSGSTVTLRFALTGAIGSVAGLFYSSLIKRYVETEANGLKARAEGTA
jgi:carbon monoxide dehydrogenase subunit G